MSLIRKPDIEVFRDSGTVVALRGAKELVQEGAGGVARTLSRFVMTAMVIAFFGSGAGAVARTTSPWAGLIALSFVGGAIGALWLIWRAPTRERAFEEGADDPVAGVSVPLPDHLQAPRAQEGFRVDYWPKAFVNQATLLILGGLSMTWAQGPHIGFPGLLGIVLLMRAFLLLSLFFGGRTCVSGTADRLTVRTLLGEGSMLWADITEVVPSKCDRRDWWTPLTTGTRRHLAVRGVPGLGKSELLIPYALLGLNGGGMAELTVRIRRRVAIAQARQAAAYVAGTPFAAAPSAPAPSAPDPSALLGFVAPRRPAPTLPTLDGGSGGFDPDAIMARYLAERECLQRAAAPLPMPAPAVRTFGRKRA